MGQDHTKLFIACIKCGNPPSSVLETKGGYSDILMEMLQEVSSTIPGWNNSDISYITFDATKGQLPRRQSLDGYDAVVITSSGKNKPYYVAAIPNANKRFNRSRSI